MAYSRHEWKNEGESNAIPLSKVPLNEIEAQVAQNEQDIANEIVARTQALLEIVGRIVPIENIIPPQASDNNELADKAFVNSSITTATAYFRGTYNSVAELNAYSGEKTINDYAYVVTMVQGLADKYDRYKWNGSAWVFEYTINTSGFTAAQLAAINSGISASLLQTIQDNISNKENTSNKATSLANADNNHYPTTLAVVNAINSIAIYNGEHD